LLQPGLPGDFNDHGTVDAADYTLWQDNQGAADELSLNGNGDGSNGVDQADYALWVGNFNNTPSAGGICPRADIPELVVGPYSRLVSSPLSGVYSLR